MPQRVGRQVPSNVPIVPQGEQIGNAFGIWDRYEDGLVIIGLTLQAFVFNCLMLPVSLTAVWRWRRSTST